MPLRQTAAGERAALVLYDVRAGTSAWACGLLPAPRRQGWLVARLERDSAALVSPPGTDRWSRPDGKRERRAALIALTLQRDLGQAVLTVKQTRSGTACD